MKTIKKFFQEYRKRANEPELDAQGNPVNEEALLKAICIAAPVTLLLASFVLVMVYLILQIG